MNIIASAEFKDISVKFEKSGFVDYLLMHIESDGVYMLLASLLFALVTFLFLRRDSLINAIMTSTIVLLSFIIIFPTFSSISSLTKDKDRGVEQLDYNAEYNINKVYNIGNLDNLYFTHKVDPVMIRGKRFLRVTKSEVEINSIELNEKLSLTFVYRDTGEPTLVKANNVTDEVIEYLER